MSLWTHARFPQKNLAKMYISCNGKILFLPALPIPSLLRPSNYAAALSPPAPLLSSVGRLRWGKQPSTLQISTCLEGFQ